MMYNNMMQYVSICNGYVHMSQEPDSNVVYEKSVKQKS